MPIKKLIQSSESGTSMSKQTSQLSMENTPSTSQSPIISVQNQPFTVGVFNVNTVEKYKNYIDENLNKNPNELNQEYIKLQEQLEVARTFAKSMSDQMNASRANNSSLMNSSPEKFSYDDITAAHALVRHLRMASTTIQSIQQLKTAQTDEAKYYAEQGLINIKTQMIQNFQTEGIAESLKSASTSFLKDFTAHMTQVQRDAEERYLIQRDYGDFELFLHRLKQSSKKDKEFIEHKIFKPKSSPVDIYSNSDISGTPDLHGIDATNRLRIVGWELFGQVTKYFSRKNPKDEFEREKPRIIRTTFTPLWKKVSEKDNKDNRDYAREMIGTYVSQHEFIKLRQKFQNINALDSQSVDEFFKESKSCFSRVLDGHVIKIKENKEYKNALSQAKEDVSGPLYIAYEFGHYEKKALNTFYKAYSENIHDIQQHFRIMHHNSTKLFETLDPELLEKFTQKIYRKEGNQGFEDMVTFFGMKSSNGKTYGRAEALKYMVNYYHYNALHPNIQKNSLSDFLSTEESIIQQNFEKVLDGIHLLIYLSNFDLLQSGECAKSVDKIFSGFDMYYQSAEFLDRDHFHENPSEKVTPSKPQQAPQGETIAKKETLTPEEQGRLTLKTQQLMLTELKEMKNELRKTTSHVEEITTKSKEIDVQDVKTSAKFISTAVKALERAQSTVKEWWDK